MTTEQITQLIIAGLGSLALWFLKELVNVIKSLNSKMVHVLETLGVHDIRIQHLENSPGMRKVPGERESTFK